MWDREYNIGLRNMYMIKLVMALMLMIVLESPLFIASGPYVEISSAIQGSQGIDTSLHADREEFEVNNELSTTGFTIYVLRITTNGINVSGEASLLTQNTRALGRFEISVPGTGYAVGYSFSSFTALIIESKYLLMVKPPVGEETAIRVLQLMLKAQGEGTLRVGSVYFWSPKLGEKLYYKQTLTGEILANINITLNNLLPGIVIKAPAAPRVFPSKP